MAASFLSLLEVMIYRVTLRSMFLHTGWQIDKLAVIGEITINSIKGIINSALSVNFTVRKLLVCH